MKYTIVESALTLISIIAHARSGALERAEQLFAEAGLDRVQDDPAVLSVRGRLLKDRALAAKGTERKRLYLKAAQAYARAAEIGGATYPLINAATLSLLAGRQPQAQTLARRVLAALAAKPEEAETPYWRAATKAEAQLLLGETPAAKDSLREAIALAPRAFEDHASTLRQFELILRALRESRAWLDPFRPPRALHFAGHINIPLLRGNVQDQIRDFVRRERIGFGFGALAAGADILIAEALLEAGAELHLVLPVLAPRFRQSSVARFGGDWASRFDQVAQRAATIHALDTEPNGASFLAVGLAAEIAMGKAVMLAEALMTESVQLVLLATGPRRADDFSTTIAGAWRESGRRQHLIPVRRRMGTAKRTRRTANASARLTAVLRLEFPGADAINLNRVVLPRLAKIFSPDRNLTVPARWVDQAVIAGFSTPRAAAKAALAAVAALKRASGIRCAAHYGFAQIGPDPFGGKPLLLGPAAELPAEIAASTPAGAVHVSEDFAAALCAGPASGRPRVEFIGELPDGRSGEALRLFSLKH